MMIVWKSFVSYLNENLRAGKSINIKRFGTFTFDIQSELPRIATKTMNPSSDLED
jgi:nucleoid DNA-binding protein